MANMTTFKSAVVMGAIHLWGMALWGQDSLLFYLYLIGILTSLLNHGLHQDPPSPLHYLRLLDRAWMVLGTGIDTRYVLHLPGYQAPLAAACICLYVGSFLLAKWRVRASGLNRSGDLAHIITHSGATLLHLALLHATSTKLH